MTRKMKSNLLLLLGAFIWGTSFVAQSVGMDYVGPFTFNMTRFLLGSLVLFPVAAAMIGRESLRDGREKAGRRLQNGIRGGIVCGLILFGAGTLQQIGVSMTTVGKGGFITSLYIVLVPLLGVFTRRKPAASVWISVACAVVGMYLLCIAKGFRISRGDFLLLLCAVCFAFHILAVDHIAPEACGVVISCVQFLTAGILSAVCAFAAEQPRPDRILAAWQPILYAGILSCGVAYTFQVVAQKDTDPTVASLIMSLESVFSVLAGWVILGQSLTLRELAGCVLMFCAVILAQLPDRRDPIPG